jgi:light-regulated signal transduction histidine kinase (bacteriophytochrome)
VWINLISNAVKYSSKNAHPHIEIRAEEAGEEIHYSVRDNGVGFNMEYVNKLFGVFNRLHRADEFSGTGVGLAIVQRIVARHGGRAWAEGKVNDGAVFSIALPRGTHRG